MLSNKPISSVVVFGDSWAQGAELQPGEHCFGKILSEIYQAESYYNYAQASTSIPHLLIQFRSAIDNRQEIPLDSQTIALFFLTGVNRDILWDNRRNEIHLNPSNKTYTNWYLKYCTPELTQFRINSTLLALQKMCDHYRINPFFIWGWERVELWPEVDLSRFYANGKKCIVEKIIDPFISIDHLISVKPSLIYPNVSHPNQAGHTVIANELHQWIEQNRCYYVH